MSFYSLPREVQDRFVGATLGLDLPTPVAFSPWRPRATGYWLATVLMLALLIVAACYGIGDLQQPPWFRSPYLAILYSLLAAAMVFLMTRGIAVVTRKLPYRLGIYIFPSGVVDARGVYLRTFPMSDLRQTRAVSDDLLRLRFARRRTIDVVIPRKSAALAAWFWKARAELDRVLEEDEDGDTLTLIDPLRKGKYTNPLSTGIPIAPQVPLWLRYSFLTSIGFGAVVGCLVWYARDLVDDELAFTLARNRDVVAGYEAYQARGGRRAEALDELLPRARLREAIERGGPEAIVELQIQHPAPSIAEEVDAALHAALQKELREAQARGTLEALAQLGARFPDRPFLQEAVAQARHQAFEEARRSFEQRAAQDRALHVFVERLLEYAEQKGARAEVRFRRLQRQQLSLADELIAADRPYFPGPEWLPSQYFEGTVAEKRELAVAAKIAGELQEAFPQTIVQFSPGATVLGEEPVEVHVPTLWIDYSAQLSGRFRHPYPRGVYAGLGVVFTARWELPGRPEQYSFHRIGSWNRPNWEDQFVQAPKPADVYESMATRAFDTLRSRLIEQVFRSSSEPAASEEGLPVQ